MRVEQLSLIGRPVVLRDKRRPWAPRELETLDDLAGTTDPRMIARQLRVMGYDRNYNAVRGKLQKMGLSSVAELDNVRSATLASWLQVPTPTIRFWIQHRGLPAKRPRYSSQYRIRRKDFAAWARQNPHLLRRCDAEGLAGFLDVSLAELRQILE